MVSVTSSPTTFPRLYDFTITIPQNDSHVQNCTNVTLCSSSRIDFKSPLTDSQSAEGKQFSRDREPLIVPHCNNPVLFPRSLPRISLITVQNYECPSQIKSRLILNQPARNASLPTPNPVNLAGLPLTVNSGKQRSKPNSPSPPHYLSRKAPNPADKVRRARAARDTAYAKRARKQIIKGGEYNLRLGA